ncbi:MAG: oligoribonuclease [Acidimicrobiales bacterium]
MLAWMDLEMTGLDPARNVIVEIATIVTDDELNIVAEGPDLVIGATPAQLADMEDVVRRMHTTSGLLTAIGRSTVTVDYAAAATLEFVKTHVPAPGTVPLCGNSIAMDRRFLRHYMPALDEYFHYRTIDVSTVKELCKRWYHDLYAARPQKMTAHRALDDIRESVAELVYYREHLLRTPAEMQARAAVAGAGASTGTEASSAGEPS